MSSWLVACGLRCPSAGSNLPHLLCVRVCVSVCMCLCGSFLAMFSASRFPPLARLSTQDPSFCSTAKLSQLKLGTFPRWLCARTHDSHSRIATLKFWPAPRCLFIGLSRFIISDGKSCLNLSAAQLPAQCPRLFITETPHIKRRQRRRLLVFNYAVFSSELTYRNKKKTDRTEQKYRNTERNAFAGKSFTWLRVLPTGIFNKFPMLVELIKTQQKLLHLVWQWKVKAQTLTLQ